MCGLLTIEGRSEDLADRRTNCEGETMYGDDYFYCIALTYLYA